MKEILISERSSARNSCAHFPLMNCLCRAIQSVYPFVFGACAQAIFTTTNPARPTFRWDMMNVLNSLHHFFHLISVYPYEHGAIFDAAGNESIDNSLRSETTT